MPRTASRLLLGATAVFCAVAATQSAFNPVALAQTEAESSSVMPSTTPSETEAARAAITRGYQILDQAIAAKDATALAKVFAPDAKIVSSGIEFGLTEYQAMLSNMLAPLIEVSQITEIESLDIAGDRATVAIRGRFRMVSKGADGKPAVMEVRGTATDTWLATPEGWRLAKTLETSQQLLIDGVEQGTAAPLSATERQAIAGDIRTSAHPLASVEPGSALDDLVFLDDVVGDARVVELGESSHGSSEQFKMKHRIIEYLVARKGFTVVAFEANWSATGAVNDYVKGGAGSATAGLERLGFWIWRTEEIRNLIEWMHGENLRRKGKKPVSFTGFDIQQFDNPLRCVLDAFAKLGGPDLARLEKLYAVEAGSGPPQSAKELADLLADLRNRAREALDILDGRRTELVAASSESEFQKARQCARVILQNAENLDAGLSMTVRDQAMADNVRWLSEVAYPGEKIVLWAHNGHVGVQPGTMGGHLRQVFGKDMVVVGFASHDGEIRAVPLKDGKIDGQLYSLVGPVPMPLPAPADGSVGDALNAAGLPRYFLDLGRVPATTVLGEWLAKPQSETSIGWPYDPTKSNARSIVLPSVYDGIVFIAESTATALLK